MKRWPWVTSPEAMPSTSKRTTSVSLVSGPKTQRIECSGRTQVRLPGFAEAAPQRIDFGHGKDSHDPRDDFGDDFFRRPARLLDHGDVEIALLVGLDLGL